MSRVGAGAELTNSINSLLGLKYGILFTGTSTRAPVFGCGQFGTGAGRLRDFGGLILPHLLYPDPPQV